MRSAVAFEDIRSIDEQSSVEDWPNRPSDEQSSAEDWPNRPNDDRPGVEIVRDLAPASSIRPRTGTYLGDTLALSIIELPSPERALLRELYSFCTNLGHTIDSATRGYDLGYLQLFLDRHNYSKLADRCSALGTRNGCLPPSSRLRRIYHDLRGGSLVALIAHLDLLELGQDHKGDIARIRVLCRDLCDLLRASFPDLDPVRLERDLERRPHTIDGLLERHRLISERCQVSFTINCLFSGSVSDCRMEFAALNRVLCNLVDNASRFAADQSVTLYVVPVNTHGAYTNLRFAVVNKLDSFQKKILQEHYGNNLHFLFAGGFTTDGSGLGMSICADFVTDSYGLSCNEEAADHGYFGARLLGDYFAVWFHWPGRQLTERNQPSSDAA